MKLIEMFECKTTFCSFLIYATLLMSVKSLPAGPYPPLSPETLVVEPLNNLQEVTNRKIAAVINPSKAFSFVPTFPDSGRKQAVIEVESPVSQIDTAYGNLQQFVASFYNPKPIVDTIQEHEKYGNDGGKHRQVGIAIINGFEALSNVLNTAVEVPFETVRQVNKKVSATLNTLGAKLSGL